MSEVNVENIEAKIKKILLDKVGIGPEKITTKISFDELNLDSLDRVEVVLSLEDEFGVQITDEEAEKIQTVGEAIKFIETKTRGC